MCACMRACVYMCVKERERECVDMHVVFCVTLCACACLCVSWKK